MSPCNYNTGILTWLGSGWRHAPRPGRLWCVGSSTASEILFAMACHSSGVVGGVITSSIYSSQIAWQTSRTTMEIVFGGMRQTYWSSVYFAPEAMCLSETANSSTGSSGSRYDVCCFVRRCSIRVSISSYISGGVLIKFLKAVGSSSRSSTIS